MGTWDYFVWWHRLRGPRVWLSREYPPRGDILGEHRTLSRDFSRTELAGALRDMRAKIRDRERLKARARQLRESIQAG